MAQYIYDGEDLGHPHIQSTTVLCDKHTEYYCGVSIITILFNTFSFSIIMPDSLVPVLLQYNKFYFGIKCFKKCFSYLCQWAQLHVQV